VSSYNKSQLDIAAINNGLQQCLEKNDNTTATVKVYKKECSKYFPHPTGEDHPRWNPNLTDEDRQAASYGRGTEFNQWSRSVLERDNFTCQISGARGVHLAAHHIYNWAHYPEHRFDIRNGITLRRDLHTQFHELYGHGPNTLAQFAQFAEFIHALPTQKD
jgi:hypothetical protein